MSLLTPPSLRKPPSLLKPTRDVSCSVLSYFGGKWALAPWIIAHMPEHRVYVEPFGGAASVLLRKPRSPVEVYNDLDEEIVGIFRVIQDPVSCRALMRRLQRTPYARREFELAFQKTQDPILRAQRAIIRAHLSFHHGALFDPKKRSFANASHFRQGGKKGKIRKWCSYPRILAEVCRRFRGVVIEQQDALHVIQRQDAPDTLFFIDPPYLHATRDKNVGYRHEMDDDQHRALLTLLLSVQGRAILSGYAHPLYDATLKGWTRITKDHYAGTQGFSPRTEVLWIK